MPGKSEFKVYFLSSISNIPSCIIWGLVAVLIIGCVILVLRKGWREGLRATAVLLLVEWIFLILCSSVLFREAHVERQCHLIPFDSYFHYPENSYFIEASAVNVLNIVLFVPLGLLLGLGFRGMTWKTVFLVGLGISFSIELFQFLIKRGLFETDDLIHNLIGCMFGYGIYRLTLRLIKHV